MTQQYLAGELSMILAQLCAASSDRHVCRCASRLRRAAETEPIEELGTIVERALGVTDRLCWSSLTHGDLTAFERQARLGAELREFGLCARLLDGVPADDGRAGDPRETGD